MRACRSPSRLLADLRPRPADGRSPTWPSLTPWPWPSRGRLPLGPLLIFHGRAAGQQDHFAAGLLDLFLGRLAEAVGRDLELLLQLAVAQHLQHVEPAAGEILRRERLEASLRRPAANASSISPTLTTATVSAQRLLKPRLGIRCTSGMSPPVNVTRRAVAVARAGALVTAAGRLAVARADAAADAACGFLFFGCRD